MSKETEELLFFGLIGLVVLMLLSNSSSGAIGLAKSNNATNVAYASDAASVINNLADDFGD